MSNPTIHEFFRRFEISNRLSDDEKNILEWIRGLVKKMALQGRVTPIKELHTFGFSFFNGFQISSPLLFNVYFDRTRKYITVEHGHDKEKNALTLDERDLRKTGSIEGVIKKIFSWLEE